jgi:hypothetical protein
VGNDALVLSMLNTKFGSWQLHFVVGLPSDEYANPDPFWIGV